MMKNFLMRFFGTGLLMLMFMAGLAGCGGGGENGSETSAAKASPNVSIIPASDGTYLVRAENFSAIGGVKATITYDTTTLRNPTVEKGAFVSTDGSLFIPNTTVPGSIVMAAINPTGFNGSGVIATISFEKVGTSQEVINSLTFELTQIHGNVVVPLPAEGTIQPNSEEPTGPSSSVPSTSGSTEPAP